MGKIYRYRGKLWAKAPRPAFASKDEHLRSKVKTALDWLIYHNKHYTTCFARDLEEDRSREAMLKKAAADMAKMLLVDGILYERTAKPEYHIQTFGCGNGDGTGLFVRYPARRDCGWHYPADMGREAVAKAKEIAKSRGDFADIKTYKPYIVCH